MSEKLINRSPDLKRLRDEGYEVEIRHGFLIIHSIPYVNSRREIVLGKLATDLTLSNDQTVRPSDHQVWFAGEHPCNHDGSQITGLGNGKGTKTLCEGLEVHYRFSAKTAPVETDYYDKMTRYIAIITNQARTIDGNADARTFKPIPSSEEHSVFLYTDSASSRAGISNLAQKLAAPKLAIVGLGGTGAYVLDIAAKTHAEEIHLFDGDLFLQHNAFRAPGAASIQTLEEKLPKVQYFDRIYSKMRRGIVPHPEYVTEENISALAGFDFVFICVDKPAVRKLLFEYLRAQNIPFVDAGMELELIEEEQSVIGTCRVTMSTPEKSDHLGRHVSLQDAAGDDLYRSNIQIADLNALCAIMAVMRWKKFCGFYQDCYSEHQSAYVVNTHQLTRDELKNPPTE
jgi:hypothetical protein